MSIKFFSFFIIIYCYQQCLMAQKTFGFPSYPWLSEEDFYHKLKDSLPIYQARLNKETPALEDIRKIVSICNTAAYYDPILSISKSFGYDEQKKHEIDSIRDVIKGVYPKVKVTLKEMDSINKVVVVKNNLLYIYYNDASKPNVYLDYVRLNMYKQNKILDVIKCNDVLDGKLGKVPLYIKTHLSEFRPGNWDDDTISVDPLDKQLELWRSEAYFLPIEQWVNIFPEKQIKAFLKASGL